MCLTLKKEMKKYCYCSMVMLLVTFASSCGSVPTQEELGAMSLEERWSYLEEGQTSEEVHHLLGEPVRTIQNGNIRLDQYACALCLTKVDATKGLLAWNPPVEGFEEEAQLFYIGEEPSDLGTSILKGITSSIFSNNGNTAINPTTSSQEIKDVLDGVFQEIEALGGVKGQELKEALQKNGAEGLAELRQFLDEHIGENGEQLVALQQQLLQQGWDEHGEEAIQALEKLTQELRAMKRNNSSISEDVSKQ